MSHRVIVTDGAEYVGETYIRCIECRVTFNDGHRGLAALLEFLGKHEAIPPGELARVRELTP